MTGPRLTHDVIIVGAGYTGALAATVLARRGYRVAVVEGAALPRFSVGESTTPEQLLVHAYLGTEWGLPELVRLSSFDRIRKSPVTIPVWPKRSLYFLMNPAESRGAAGCPHEILYQTVPPSFHCMRGEFDLHLANLARQRGADLLVASRMTDIDVSGPVRCALAGGDGPRELVGRLLIDASGPSAFLGSHLGLVDRDPANMPLRSRAVFTHFLGVRGVEDTYGRSWPKLPVPRDLSTLHHLWPTAWAWVIPFDNRVTSVGVVMDAARDEVAGASLSPEERFWARGRTNPAFETMMADACPIRPWSDTGIIQWNCTRVVGPNWVILPPASGIVDPLLSPGMAMAAISVGRLAYGIDRFLRDGRPADEALGWMDPLHSREIEYVSRLQQILHRSFADFEVLRESFVIYRICTLLRALSKAREGLPLLLQELWGFGFGELRELVDETNEILGNGLAQQAASRDVASEIRQAVRRADARFGFLGSGCDDGERRSIYLTELVPQVVWSMRLERAKGTGWGAAILNPWVRLVFRQTLASALIRARDVLFGASTPERGSWRHTARLFTIMLGMVRVRSQPSPEPCSERSAGGLAPDAGRSGASAQELPIA